MVMTDISGCKYHDPMLVMKFNLDIQYVGLTMSSCDNILIPDYANDKGEKVRISK